MTHNTTPAPGKNTPGRKKLICLLSIVITIIVLLLVLLFSAVEFRPIAAVPQPGDLKEQIILARLPGKIMRTLNAARQDKTGKDCVLTITQEELNALLNTACRLWELNKKSQDPAVYAQSANGVLTLEGSKKYSGVYLNFRMTVRAAIAGEKVVVKVQDCSIGKLPISAALAEKNIEQAMSKYTGDPRWQMLMKAIKSAQFLPDGALQITIDKSKANYLLMSLL